MLSKEYIERVVEDALMLPPGERVFMTQGYDESVAVIQNVRHIDWPAIIAEDRSGGTLTLLEGGHDSHTQSLWIMNQPGNGEEPSDAYRRSFEQMKKIVATMAIRAFAPHDEAKIYGLQADQFPYYRRRAATAYGYEVLLYFEEEVDLTDDGTGQ